MALIKTKTQNRVTGEYWFIIQVNRNRGDHKDLRVELALYTNKADRVTDKAADICSPLPVPGAVFNFTAQDHPFVLDNFDPDSIVTDYITDDLNSPTDHMLYLHIKAVGQFAAARVLAPGEYLTPNEQAALFFADAQDDVP